MKQQVIQNQDSDPASVRKARAEQYTDQVKRKQIHNELTVEMIIRKRSLEGRMSFHRCITDTEARKIWDENQNNAQQLVLNMDDVKVP
ncbi:hypothetical protein MPER_16197, partial [Moniliophthora perniciosa FA553]